MDAKKKFNYIIYHEGCLDGFTGLFIATLSGMLTDDVLILGDSPTTNKVPSDIKNMDIIIIDVAYKTSILEIIFKNAKTVVFIDHHVSIKSDVGELHEKYNKNNNITIIYNDEHCASLLTWQYFFKNQKKPLFLKYINDQDTGKWDYPKTKQFIIALKIYHKINTKKSTIDSWRLLLDKSYVRKLVKIGKYMKEYNDYIIESNVTKHTLKRFPSQKVYEMNPDIFNKLGQYSVAIYCGHNCPSITELGTAALKVLTHIDFCILWVYNLNSKKYILSVRSRTIDVSNICKIFNGGGHKLAGAFSFSSSFMTIDDLFYNTKTIN